jgi:hypothetical protein
MKKKVIKTYSDDPIESKRNKKPKQDNKHDPARKNKKYFMNNANSMETNNDNC